MWSGPFPAPSSFPRRDRSSSASHMADTPWAPVSCAGLTGRSILSESTWKSKRWAIDILTRRHHQAEGRTVVSRGPGSAMAARPPAPDCCPASRPRCPFTALFTICKNVSDHPHLFICAREVLREVRSLRAEPRLADQAGVLALCLPVTWAPNFPNRGGC